MESAHWTALEGDSLILPYDSVTYLFLPVMQMELAEDVTNDSILNEVALADAQNAQEEASHGNALREINAGLSADGTKLNISYTLDKNSSIDFCACDILGNILGRAHYDNQEAGEWQESITISYRPLGNIVMIYTKINTENYSIKVIN